MSGERSGTAAGMLPNVKTPEQLRCAARLHDALAWEFCRGYSLDLRGASEAVGIEPVRLAAYLNADAPPNIDDLYKIAKATSTSLDWLVDGAGCRRLNRWKVGERNR